MEAQTTIRNEILAACLVRNTDLSGIAARLGVDPSTVSQWFRRGRIPAERVLALEKLTGIPRSRLRPDIYP